MTDQQLITLLQDNLPQDLPPELLDALRQRIASSPELRQAVLTELKLEQGLATAHAPSPQRWEELLARHPLRDHVTRRWALMVALLVCAAVLVTTAAFLLHRLQPQHARNLLAQATTQPAPGAAGALPANAGEASEDDSGGGGTSGGAVAAVPLQSPPTESAQPPSAPVADRNSENENAPAPTAAAEGTPQEIPGAGASLSPQAAQALLLDNASSRGDSSWILGWTSLLSPTAGSRTSEGGRNLHLQGTYLVSALPDQTHLLRLVPGIRDTPQSFQIDFWAGLDGVRITANGIHGYAAYRLHRAAIPAAAPAPTAIDDPRLNRAAKASRIDPQIAFTWTGKSPIAGAPAQDFAVRWSGNLEIHHPGRHTFYLTADDGIRLYLDGKAILDDWQDHSATTTSATIDLSRGSHPIQIDYYQGAGEASVKLEWQGPGISRQIVPASVLLVPPEDLAGNRARPGHLRAAAHGLRATYYWGPQVRLGPIALPQIAVQVVSRLSDDGFRRGLIGDGVLDLRYQDGQIVLARGDLVLLTAPLPAPPTSAALTADCDLAYARRLPCLPLNLAAPQPGLIALDSARPAALGWQLSAPNAASLTTLPSGALQFAAPARPSASKEPVFALADLGPPVGTQVTFHLAHLSAGTGLAYVGPDTSHHGYVWIAPEKGQLVLVNAPDNAGERAARLADGFTVHEQIWLRLNFSANSVRIEASHDGTHWFYFDQFATDAWSGNPGIARARCGPAILPGFLGARLQIDHLTVRTFDAWQKLAAPDLLQQVADTAFPANWGTCVAGIDAACPPNVPLPPWRLACFTTILTRSSPLCIRRPAALALLAAAVEAGLPLSQVEPALAQWPWLVGTPFSDYEVQPLYQALCRNPQNPQDEAALQRLLQDSLEPPYTPQITGPRPATVYPPALLRLVLLQRVATGQWAQAQHLARRALFLCRYSPSFDRPYPDAAGIVRELAAWVAATAFQMVPQPPNAQPPTWLARWTHPLIVDTDRDTANLLADFQASVQTKAYDHACRVLTQRILPNGIAPEIADSHLFQSIHVVARETLRANPQLRQTLDSQFSALAELRLRQAMAHNDSRMLQAIPVQFYGTPAAAAALERLADQELSLGNFYAAAARYQELLDDYQLPDAATIAAKRRLALAMTGEIAGPPITHTVHLPGGNISARDFESLIAECAHFHGRAGSTEPPAPALNPPAPGPTPLTARLLDSPLLGLPNRLDVNTSLGLTLDHDRLFVHTDRQILACDLTTGQTLWTFDAGHRGPRNLILNPGPCLALGSSLLTTVPIGRTATLLGLDTAARHPRRLWRRDFDDGIVSDPWTIGPWAFILTQRRIAQGDLQLLLRRIAPATGESVMSAPVVQFRPTPWLPMPARPAVSGDSLIYSCGGALMSLSPLGQVRWIRQLAYFPLEAAPSSPWLQNQTTPIVAGPLVFTAGPGTPFLYAVHVTSGDLAWTRLEPNLCNLIGIVHTAAASPANPNAANPDPAPDSGQHLIIASDQAITALDAATGQPVWRRPFDGLPTALLIASPAPAANPAPGGPGSPPVDSAGAGAPPAPRNFIFALHDLPPSRTSPATIEALWLSPTDGAILHRETLPGLHATQPRFLITDGRTIAGLASTPAGPRLFILQPAP